MARISFFRRAAGNDGVFGQRLFIFGLGSSTIALGQHSGSKYQVVINHEEQYSIWLLDKKPPKGWKYTGINGSQERCQKYIREVWTDMRPLSVRKMKRSKNAMYQVVINHEEQYSIWPTEKNLPKGWKTTKVKGSLAKCMDHIEEVWTDMRPLSLRKRMRQGKN